ncbi:metallophosphoesterase family protein [Candidatus Bipolaricaulota bacterium]|nr:metallophosphoesterase family protein [Candidatus Bipolaricaulota bacterium]
MKVGLISDVHGNWEALNVVLKRLQDEEGVDEVFCGGDIVGYGPEPNKCVSELGSASPISVKGNHDAGLVGELQLDFFNRAGLAALKWTKDEITKQNRAFLEQLPQKRFLSRERISLLHGSSVNPLTHYITRKVDAYRSFQRSEEEFDLQIFGHTHLPVVYEIAGEDVEEYRIQGSQSFSFEPNKKYLINPGSVGQPRDGNWKTSFAVLDLTGDMFPEQVTFYRREYPAEETRQKIIDAELPSELGNRLLHGR